MPYIVTTKWDGAKHPHPTTPERPNPRAVATLDEAREYVADLVFPAYGTARAHAIGQSTSASSGPLSLPDGTVIEVERVSTDELGLRAMGSLAEPDVIAAYNAAQ